MEAQAVFLGDTFVPVAEAHISVLTHGFSYGTGCFEGIRGYWNEEDKQVYLFRLREHFSRLLESCRIMQIGLSYSPADLVEIALELVRKNELRENIYIRAVAYMTDEIIGCRLHGLQAGFTMMAVPMGDYIDTHGLRCGVSSWRRIDDTMIPARAKVCGAYVNSALAKSEAVQNGFDEAIMLTAEGHVSEGSAENIFLYLHNQLITPSPAENILSGITRDSVMQLASNELNIPTYERPIDKTELYIADEIFLTGTGAQIAPVVVVDHRQIGSGSIGPLGAKIQQLYMDAVYARLERYRHWCTPAYIIEPTSPQDNWQSTTA